MSKKYTIVEQFTGVNPVSMNPMNYLVSSRNLDELLFWEEQLERKGLDYAIIYQRGMYHIITDMGKWLEGVRNERVGIYNGLSELFLT